MRRWRRRCLSCENTRPQIASPFPPKVSEMASPSRPSHRPSAREPEGPTLIWGTHAVEAALRNPARRIARAFLTDNAEHRVADVLATRGLKPERILPRDLDRRLGPDTVHQGSLVETEQLVEPRLEAMAAAAAGRPLVLLDHITDPHNAGAILRSAAVFGCGGVVMTKRHSPPLSGALAKTASGALEHVPVALVQNLARSMAELKGLGFRLIGLDGDGTVDLADVAWPWTSAIVLGAEGRGLRELTRETCDEIACIGADGPLASLNVSNAAAVALHLAQLRRRGQGAG